ncbi:uncharacterized protein TNCV_3151591 [Trichonephila clavipes]|nr:uncharacterized protein TNCV_3151591 [Trichonephila clavipes]
MDSLNSCPGEDLVLPNLTIDEMAKNTRFFILSLPNNEMSGKSPFAVFKALQAICEPKSVKKIKSGDLLIETNSAVQSKSYLSAKTFLDSPLLVTPHKSLNSSRESHPSNSKLCPKWKTEKEIQVIKTNRNILHVEARKLIAPQLSQSYAQVTKHSTATTTTQTDENITKIVCPPLKLLQPLITDPKSTISSSAAAINKSSTSTQTDLVPSTSSVTVASPSKSQPPKSVIDTAPITSNRLSISAASSSSTACSVLETTTTISNTILATSQDANQTSKLRRKKHFPKNQSNTIKPKI